MTTPVDLSTVYTSTGLPPFQEGAVLRCTDHPEWEIDADGTALPVSIDRAVEHVRDEHSDHHDV